MVKAEYRCWSCGRSHEEYYQTKFFDPDFNGLFNREFRLGLAHPIDFDPHEWAAPRLWEYDWLPLAGWQVGQPLRLLNDENPLTCRCGQVMLLSFEFNQGTPGYIVLTETACLAAADFGRFSRAHFIDLECLEDVTAAQKWSAVAQQEPNVRTAKAFQSFLFDLQLHGTNLMLWSAPSGGGFIGSKTAGGLGLCLWDQPDGLLWVEGDRDQLLSHLADEKDFASASSWFAAGCPA